MNYVYDTNMLVYIIKQNPVVEKFEKEIAQQKENLRIISIVTKAEIETLSVLFKWGEHKREQLKNLLDQFLIVPIDSHKLVAAYVELDAYSQGKHPSKSLGTTSRNMGKNDLWIAATASVTYGTLLTTDDDFDHLNHVFIKVKKPSIKKRS